MAREIFEKFATIMLSKWNCRDENDTEISILSMPNYIILKISKKEKISDDMTQAHLWGGANFRNSLVLLYFTSSFETNWTKAQKNMNNAMISFENKQYAVAMPLLLSMYTTKLSVWSNIWEICQHKKTHRNMQKRKWLLDGGDTSFWPYLCKRQTKYQNLVCKKIWLGTFPEYFRV